MFSLIGKLLGSSAAAQPERSTTPASTLPHNSSGATPLGNKPPEEASQKEDTFVHAEAGRAEDRKTMWNQRKRRPVHLLDLLVFQKPKMSPDAEREELAHCLRDKVDPNCDLGKIEETSVVNSYEHSRERPNIPQMTYPLFFPAGARNTDLLVAAGADVNAVDMLGKTALHKAVSRSDEAGVVALLQAKADVNKASKSGSLLIPGSNKPQPTLVPKLGTGDTPLHLAVKAVMKSDSAATRRIVDLLINAGANVQAPDYRGETPLHWAVEFGDLEMVESFIRKSPEAVNIPSTMGKVYREAPPPRFPGYGERFPSPIEKYQYPKAPLDSALLLKKHYSSPAEKEKRPSYCEQKTAKYSKIVTLLEQHGAKTSINLREDAIDHFRNKGTLQPDININLHIAVLEKMEQQLKDTSLSQSERAETQAFRDAYLKQLEEAGISAS